MTVAAASQSAPPAPPAPPRRRPRRAGAARLGPRDRLTLTLMGGIPSLLTIAFVWVPALATIVLSFASWTGIGGFDQIQWVGTKNYTNIFTIYPQFPPAIEHNLIWLVVFFALPARSACSSRSS